MRGNLAIVRLQQELSAANERLPLAASCSVRPVWRTWCYDCSWSVRDSHRAGLRRANRAAGRGFASGVAACRCCIGQRTRWPMQMRLGRFGPPRFAPRRVYCRTRSGSRCVRAVGGRRRQPFSGGRLYSATQFEGRLDAPECFLGAAAAIADDVALVEEATRHALIDGDRFDLSSSQ